MTMTAEEIFEVKAGLAVAKNKSLNFAICMGKSPAAIVVLLHKTRSADVLAREVKAQGETKKIAFGRLDVVGSVIELRCEDAVPTGIAKQVRLFLAANKMSFKVKAMDPTGATADAEDDDASAKPAATAQGAPAETQAQSPSDPVADPVADPGTTETTAVEEPSAQAKEWARIVETVTPQVSAFVQSGAEKAAQVGAIWQAAQTAAANGKIADAKAAVAKIMPVLKQPAAGSQPSTPTPDATTANPSATDPTDTVSRIEGALKAHVPRIQDVLKRLPSLKTEVLGLIAQARTAARAGDATAADALVQQLVALLDKTDSQQRDAGQGTAGVSAMKLGKARLEWPGVRSIALDGVATVKSEIRRVFAHRPDLASEVEAGLGRLDKAVGQINDDLARALDLVLNEQDAAKRAALARQVATLTRRFVTLTTTDPVISAIDGSLFAKGKLIVKPMVDKLDEILDALAQPAPETAA